MALALKDQSMTMSGVKTLDFLDHVDVKDFLNPFVKTNQEQHLGILRNVTRHQCTYIRHLAYNIMFNTSFELSNKDRSFLRRHSSSIKELSSKKVCIERKKYQLITKHRLIKQLAQLTLT